MSDRRLLLEVFVGSYITHGLLTVVLAAALRILPSARKIVFVHEQQPCCKKYFNKTTGHMK